MNFAANEVAINCNVFGSFMEDWIGSNVDCGLVVVVNGGGFEVATSKSCRSCEIQVSSLIVLAKALYLASAEERDTTDCFLVF